MAEKRFIEGSISSVLDLLQYLKNIRGEAIFRGQADKAWPLLPKIGRLDPDALGYEDWLGLEEHLLEQFRKYSISLVHGITTDLEWLVLAQHHGLPTRLLDWTTNPLKGLFFAVENKSVETDSALWILEPEGWFEGLATSLWFKDLQGLKQIRVPEVYFPDHVTQRLVAQEGCFTIHPLYATCEPLDPVELLDTTVDYRNRPMKTRGQLVKLVIPKPSRAVIRTELVQFGILHRSLFPGLDGIAKTIEWNLALWE